MTPQTHHQKVIWIIGASSGIGAALSQELAAQGAILCLSARRVTELEQLQNLLPGEGHEVFPLDVCDSEAVTKTAQRIYTRFGRMDRVIFLSAAYHPMGLDALEIRLVRQMVETNLLAAFYVIHAVLPLFKTQSYGQIALCGSVAGYVGLPGGQPYSATKAALINLGESLLSELPSPLDVKIINPGFVKTQLTEKNNFTMPLMITPEQAALYISEGLLKKDFEIHFPRKLTFWMKVLRALPYPLLKKFTKRFTKGFNRQGKSSCSISKTLP